jgi:hypothetical protein
MKELKVYTANISRDGEVRHEFLSFYQKITDDDKLIEEITWSAKDEIESKTVYEYDSKGRLIKELNYYDEEEFSDGRELLYNDQDQLEMIRIKYADESETLQKYERLPNLSRISYYSEDNELEYTEERKTDDNNNLLEFTKYGPNNKPEHIIKLSYDDYGRLSETLDNDIIEDFRSVTRMEYDERNNLIQEITYTEKGNVMNSRISTYNEKDELIEEVVNDYSITYVLNDEGERIERKITNQSGQLEELTSYIYDEEGKLIEERFYKSSDLNVQDLFQTAYLRKRYEY